MLYRSQAHSHGLSPCSAMLSSGVPVDLAELAVGFLDPSDFWAARCCLNSILSA